MSDMFVFAKDKEAKQEVYEIETWKILVADDEEDVHKMTTLILEDLIFENKRLTLYHAYSGAETISLSTRTSGYCPDSSGCSDGN
jgi:hypothetical protein